MPRPGLILTWPAATGVAIVATGTPPRIDATVAAEIDRIWAAEQARRGESLFNGALFSVATVAPDGISGTIVEYRWFIAQRRAPALFPALQVRPLAVGGLLWCGDGLVFGRRSDRVEQDPGYWEPVPSGGVDGSRREADGRLDADGQLLAELAEEVGLDATDLTAAPEPVVIVEDGVSHVTVLAMALPTALDARAIGDRFAALPRREHTELTVVAADAVPAFLAAHRGEVNPAAAAAVQAGLAKREN